VYRCYRGLTLAATSTQAGKVDEDDRIELTVPDGWSLQPVYQTVTGDRPGRDKIGVVLLDGRFELYVLTHYGQTSGIIGGRFGEISEFIVPWLNSSEPNLQE